MAGAGSESYMSSIHTLSSVEENVEPTTTRSFFLLEKHNSVSDLSKKTGAGQSFSYRSAHLDSHQGPPRYKLGALTAELWADMQFPYSFESHHNVLPFRHILKLDTTGAMSKTIFVR